MIDRLKSTQRISPIGGSFRGVLVVLCCVGLSACGGSTHATHATTKTQDNSFVQNDPACRHGRDYQTHQRCSPIDRGSSHQTFTPSNPPPTKTAEPSSPVESDGPSDAQQQAAAKLASVDRQADSVQVGMDLHELGGKCREKPLRLVEEIYNAHQDLDRNDVPESSNEVAKHLVRVTRGLGKAATPTDCASLLAAYLVLREQ